MFIAGPTLTSLIIPLKGQKERESERERERKIFYFSSFLGNRSSLLLAKNGIF